MTTERGREGGTAAETSKCPTPTFRTPDERRNASRFWRGDGTDFASIWVEAGEEILAEVHDESLSGLGILVDGPTEIQPGNDVHVVYAGEYLRGLVRHVTRQSDGRYLVGLECQQLPAEAAE